MVINSKTHLISHILDSLTWDISTRHVYNILLITGWHGLTLDILCDFQAPQQLEGSNNCGFHMFMFVDHFLKVHVEYNNCFFFSFLFYTSPVMLIFFHRCNGIDVVLSHRI